MSKITIKRDATLTDQEVETIRSRQAPYADDSDALIDFTIALSKVTDEHGLCNTMRALAHIARYFYEQIEPEGEGHAQARELLLIVMLRCIDLGTLLTAFTGVLGLRKSGDPNG